MLTLLLGPDAPLIDACGLDPGIACEWIFELTGNESVARFTEWLVAKPAKVLLVLFVAYVANRLVRRGIDHFVARLIAQREASAARRQVEEVEGRFAILANRAMEKAQRLAEQAERSKQRAEALGSVLRSVASMVIYGLALMIVFGEFGVSLGPLVAGAGIVGIALGFGAQKLVQDFLSGIFMLIEDQYGVGDVIDVGEAAGVVEEVNLRTTRLRDVHGTVWHIPNGEIRRVGNKSQQWARAVLDVEVAYDTDINHAAAVIKAVADEVWGEQLENATVLEEPEIWGVEMFGDSAVVIRVVLKVEPGEQFATMREVRKRLKLAFDREGIEIPFPQRTVWMHRVPHENGDDGGAPGPVEDFTAGGAKEGE
jgi:small conductance mechanosensitive channel